MACAFRERGVVAKCSRFRVSTVQTASNLQRSEPAKARSCTIYLMLAPVPAICLLNCRELAGTIADQSGESAQSAVANETTRDDGAKNAWIDTAA